MTPWKVTLFLIAWNQQPYPDQEKHLSYRINWMHDNRQWPYMLLPGVLPRIVPVCLQIVILARYQYEKLTVLESHDLLKESAQPHPCLENWPQQSQRHTHKHYQRETEFGYPPLHAIICPYIWRYLFIPNILILKQISNKIIGCNPSRCQMANRLISLEGFNPILNTCDNLMYHQLIIMNRLLANILVKISFLCQ